MRFISALLLAGVGLGACDMLPGQTATSVAVPSVPQERVDAFVVLVEQLNCRVGPEEDEHPQVHTAGFSDAEIVDIGQVLVAEGQAEITDTGELVLLTETCL
jgi:hypothetical protein